jgi:hypothetical protein
MSVCFRHAVLLDILMPKYKNYYIVEYRLPIVVDDINSVQEATTRAKRICENRFGFNPDNWYARIFEYSIENDGQGPVKEYFYNPHSSTYREIQSNISYHNDLVSRGIDPFDISQLDPKDLEDEGEI